MRLKEKLIKVRWQARFGVCNPRIGICGMLSGNGGLNMEETNKMLELFRTWPEGTGSHNFPVPSSKHSCGVDAYNHGKNNRMMWNIFGEYGRARRRLLNWMIKQL